MVRPGGNHPAMRWPLSVPVLSDGVVTLRAHVADDVDLMTEMAQDEAMARWTAVPVPYERKHAEDYALSIMPRLWDEGTSRGWAIEADGRFVGNIDLRGTGVLDVGFALHPAARGQGIMARAVRLVVDHAFAEGIGEVVHWRGHVGNVGSLRVAHATGFTLHGTQPGLLWERGRAIDAWTASIRFGDAPLPRTRWLDDVVETERLRVRPFVAGDLPGIVEACQDPVTRHFLGVPLPDPYGDRHAKGFVDAAVWDAATGTRACWAIADREDDRLLGHLAVMRLGPPDPGQGEIGYWLHPAARGRGIMREALRGVVDHAFSPDGLDLRRLTVFAAASNVASNAVAVAAGFRRIGTETAAQLLGDGSYDDLHGYELLR